MINKEEITLRVATPKDELALIVFMKKYHMYDEIEMSDDERLSAIRPLLSSSAKGTVWLIRLKDKEIGYIAVCNCYSIEFRGIEVWIDEFFIDEQYRGRGYGNVVLDEVKNYLKNQGVAIVHLEVDESNEKAAALYKKSGFQFREKFVMMSYSFK